MPDEKIPAPTPDELKHCVHCGKLARLTTGAEIYPHRKDLAHKPIWRCDPCDAHVGCHPKTDNPLGRPSNRGLRASKRAAHEIFDRIWKKGSMTRSEAYKWLSQQLGTDPVHTHIGYFDQALCSKVIEVCRSRPFDGMPVEEA